MSAARPPIVIIGAGRSGTKFLRDVLAASPEVGAVPYDVNYVWRRGFEGAADDVLPAASVGDRSRAYVRRTLMRMAGLPPTGDGGILVEKTVSNALRVPFVAATLPDARFLHLVRDGREVIESALRMWREPPERGYLLRKLRYFDFTNVGYAWWFAKNALTARFGGGRAPAIWGPRYPGIEEDVRRLPLVEVVARQWTECVRRATRDLAALPDERVMSVRYEALVARPQVMEEIARFVGLERPDTVIDAYGATVRADLQAKWRGAFGAQDLEIVRRVAGPTLAELGYVDEG